MRLQPSFNLMICIGISENKRKQPLFTSLNTSKSLQNIFHQFVYEEDFISYFYPYSSSHRLPNIWYSLMIFRIYVFSIQIGSLIHTKE